MFFFPHVALLTSTILRINAEIIFWLYNTENAKPRIMDQKSKLDKICLRKTSYVLITLKRETFQNFLMK